MSQTVTTTQLCKHYGVQFRPEVLIEAGIEPASKVKNGYNWNVSDVAAIGDAVIEAIKSRRNARLDLSESPTRTKKEPTKGKAAEKAHDPLNDEDDDDSL